MTPGYCSIEWSQNPNDPYSFTVTNDTDILDNTILGTPGAGVFGENCTTDYVIIPNAMINGMPTGYDRFCGNGFPTVTCKFIYCFNFLKNYDFLSWYDFLASSKPFVLTVVTNGNETATPPNTPDIGNRGFCLNYRQLPCGA